jgi:tetratricopeptide (TPR) repeat protein
MRPVIFDSILQNVSAAGAKPGEIAAIAGVDAERLTRASAFLVSRGQSKDARVLLPLIGAAGGSPEQVLLIKASLDSGAGEVEEALKSLDAARKIAPQNPRVYVLLAEAKVKAGRIDEALRDLDTGIGMNPHDLPLLRSRLSIVTTYRKWALAQGALDGLAIALAESRMPTTEVHLAAARYYATLREYGKANSEYSLVLAQEPGNAGVWAELGGLWESAGRMAPALEAYRQANALTPGNAGVVSAMQRITNQIETIRGGSALLP